MKLKPLHQQVIVITGATSGIGLATARAAARRHARLVLVARNAEVLEAIEQEIAAAGGEAIHVVADVGRRHDLQRVADAAIARFGGFDTWINNAGVSLYGRLADVTDEDHHRLFQTNFWGVVYGSLIAAAHLRRHGGSLINLGSVLSDTAIPLQGMYSASKHAVKGFTDALRMELDADHAPVSVTLIKPSAINTPYPQHAKNYLDHEASLPPPLYQPEEVARTILFAATHPKRDLIVGSAGRLMSITNRLLPRAMDRIGSTWLLDQQTLRGYGTVAHQEGILFHPGRDGRVRGRAPGFIRRQSYYTRASMHPILTGTLLLAAGLTAAALTRTGLRRPARPAPLSSTRRPPPANPSPPKRERPTASLTARCDLLSVYHIRHDVFCGHIQPAVLYRRAAVSNLNPRPIPFVSLRVHSWLLDCFRHNPPSPLRIRVHP